MNKEITKAFENVIKNGKLSADLNIYSKDFTDLRIYITNSKGRLVDSYSATQKNVTGLKNQADRFLQRVYKESKHTLEIKVS